MTTNLLSLAEKCEAGPILEAAYPDEECGCPVEEWVYRGISLNIHFEPDGSLELFADTGDWDQQVALKATDMERGRAEVFAWVDALPTEEEIAATLRASAHGEG
jgi:hypothetical protein